MAVRLNERQALDRNVQMTCGLDAGPVYAANSDSTSSNYFTNEGVVKF